MVQAVAQGQEWVITPIQQAIQAQEEEQQGPMGQEEEHQEEEHHHQEAIQVPMPAAVHLQGTHLPSSQEEQVVQAAHHRVNLQVYLVLGDNLIHGLHWTDPGKLYRSYPCPPITRVAAYLICNSF